MSRYLARRAGRAQTMLEQKKIKVDKSTDRKPPTEIKRERAKSKIIR